MATKAIILGGIAAFGLGLLGLGAAFEEPEGSAPRAGRVAQAPAPGPRWEEWKPPEPARAPAAVPEQPPVAPLETLPEDRTAPTDVWATPAEWSRVE